MVRMTERGSRGRKKGPKGRGPAPEPGRVEPPRAQPAAGETWRDILLPATGGGKRWLLGALALAFLLRVWNIKGMFPVLVDESIYMRWTEIIVHQGNWFISLLDGKPPLTYWILAVPRFVTGADPLLQGRLLSVVAGLCSTVGVFAVARRLVPAEAGERAGLIAAHLYALFPWALLYDRLAYTEAWVNLMGVAVALTSIACFDREGGTWKRALAPGLALGLGLFTKQTVVLWAGVPAAAAFFLGRKHGGWLQRLAVIYLCGGLFLGLNALLTPEAPTLESHDAVLHHTGFFADPADLLEDPFLAAGKNSGLILSYIGAYLTWPAALAALASAVWLGMRGSFAPWLLVFGSLLPVTAEVFLLELMFPTRYPFSHFWPWLAIASAGAAAGWDWLGERAPEKRKLAAGLAAVVLCGPLVARDALMLGAPQAGLHPADVEGFLGDSAHVGYGIAEAAQMIENAADQHGGLVLLVDPVWGPPADALAAMLNRRHGIHVYEAWWTQLSPTHAIRPDGTAEIIRSHYERVSGGSVDFANAGPIYYATDTHYYPRQAVLTRQPDAQLVHSFPKPGGKHSIDVYRLR